jgi:hypothetical protein
MPLPAALAAVGITGAVAVALVTRVLVGIGVGVVTFIGVQATWDAAVGQLNAYLGGLSASVTTIIAMARVDDAIAVVISAGAAKLVLAGVSAVTGLKKFTWR